MTTLWNRYDKYSRRRRRRAARAGQRLDIQGLRMVAVLTVFANHLWGWPRGGFIGVDVFFVISGFLITGNLLRDAEARGTVSFRRFYWNRVRRIMPAATVILVLTVAAAYAAFLPFHAREVAIDAAWAFVFLSNWWFGYQGTDYFRANADPVSPIQHYWSLSIEEQFYFVWPALIFLISVYVARKAFSHEKRLLLAGAVMSVIVALSLGWALYETATDAPFAYFNTFARVWELGAGALLACAVGVLSRIPRWARPVLSWGGLTLIVASVFVISDDSAGFPAPWALLPVLGSALVIAAGVGTEPNYQAFLRNPASGYVGDISYSLYLTHWPVIVIVGALMESGWSYDVVVLSVAFGLAIASYHFVENPLRKGDWVKFRESTRDIRKRRFQAQRSSALAGLAALSLIAVASTAFALRPDAYDPPTAPPAIAAAAPDDLDDPSGPESRRGPLTAALQDEIVAALQASEWPQLDPSMESVIGGNVPLGPEITRCASDEIVADPQLCTWGDVNAPTRIVLTGDSVALGYASAFRELALNSNGQIQVYTTALGACPFMNDLIDRKPLSPNCEARKQSTVDMINQTRPQIVIVANWYREAQVVGSRGTLGPGGWAESERAIIERFRGSAGKVVLLASPPGDANVKECYPQRGSRPVDCIGHIGQEWADIARAEERSAEASGATWIDSRPWFCSTGKLCPAFVATTPTKYDSAHMAPPYGAKVYSVIEESLRDAGVLP